MKKNWIRPLMAAVLLLPVLVAPSPAEIKAQLTISGDIDELIEVLKRLRDMGIGATVETRSAEPAPFRLHSVTDDEANRKAAAPPPPEPEEVVLAFVKTKVEPKTVRAGGVVLIEATLSDPWRHVETVVATFGREDAGFKFDLFDNGKRGDRKARDGIWAYDLNIPADADARRYGVKIMAYDRNGDVVTVEDERGEPVPLITVASFEVTP